MTAQPGMYMHTPPWELLGAVQCGGMLRYLGILLGAETCCATLGYSRERWHGTRMHAHTPPLELLGAVQCRRHAASPWKVECSWGRWLIAAGIPLEALAARSS